MDVDVDVTVAEMVGVRGRDGMKGFVLGIGSGKSAVGDVSCLLLRPGTLRLVGKFKFRSRRPGEGEGDREGDDGEGDWESDWEGDGEGDREGAGDGGGDAAADG